jgi:hypothetical protein
MDSIEFALRAPVPAEWSYEEKLTILAPDGQANVIFSSEPLPDDMDVSRYADIQGSLLNDEFEGYEEFVLEPTQLGEHQGLYRRFQWLPSEGEPVTQIQTYFVIDGRGYTATATTPSVSFNRFDDVFGEVLEHLSIAAAVKA